MAANDLGFAVSIARAKRQQPIHVPRFKLRGAFHFDLAEAIARPRDHFQPEIGAEAVLTRDPGVEHHGRFRIPPVAQPALDLLSRRREPDLAECRVHAQRQAADHRIRVGQLLQPEDFEAAHDDRLPLNDPEGHLDLPTFPDQRGIDLRLSIPPAKVEDAYAGHVRTQFARTELNFPLEHPDPDPAQRAQEYRAATALARGNRRLDALVAEGSVALDLDSTDDREGVPGRDLTLQGSREWKARDQPQQQRPHREPQPRATHLTIACASARQAARTGLRARRRRAALRWAHHVSSVSDHKRPGEGRRNTGGRRWGRNAHWLARTAGAPPPRRDAPPESSHLRSESD